MKLRKYYVAILIHLLENKDKGLTTTELSQIFNKKQTQGMSKDVRVLKEMGFVQEHSSKTSEDHRSFRHKISNSGIRKLKAHKEEVNSPDSPNFRESFRSPQLQF